MKMIDMFHEQLEDAKKRRLPFIIPIGTIEYHAKHLSCGTDTMVINACLHELEKEKEIVICPPIWYGTASYAVCDYDVAHINIDEDTMFNYIYCVLKSMVFADIKNIYCILHHQTEAAGLMPMTIAAHKAAKRLAMEYMEETKGKGWWGSPDFAHYYEDLGSGDDPFSYVKVIPLIGADAQIKCGGFDHAGKYETSLMMACCPKNVNVSFCKNNREWFAQSAVEASVDLGKHMRNCSLEWLRSTIS